MDAYGIKRKQEDDDQIRSTRESTEDILSMVQILKSVNIT